MSTCTYTKDHLVTVGAEGSLLLVVVCSPPCPRLDLVAGSLLLLVVVIIIGSLL
jgi:hypothetical protein